MDSRASTSEVAVIGYGSLMSGLGLLTLGRLRVRAATRVVLLNARRGFAKFSQHGDRFAMVLEPVRANVPLDARTLAADAAPTDAPEGISLVVQPNDLARLCDREGYSSGAVQRLRQEAAGKGVDLATFLWSVLDAAALDVAGFRQHLFKLVGYTSPHYIPHPVRLDAKRFAITFLAPGVEGTGSERVTPVRVRTGNQALLSTAEAWQHKPNRTQLDYFAACCVAGVHGVNVRDILQSVAENDGLRTQLRDRIVEEQPHELPRLLEMTGLNHQAYWQAFGPPNHGLRRSGLEEFLRSGK